MKKTILPPYAPSLIESIRSIGYTLESAIADLVDNSITAEATAVNISFWPHDEPYIAILDNGMGMSAEELTQAMRHGSKNPGETRSESDLGRFGLGLKTASLSQCRRLMVISLKNGYLSARCWDLDIIIAEQEWTLLELESSEVADCPMVEDLLEQGTGTLVLWQKLDRIQSGESSIEKALGDKMDRVREHLSLVFHRFIQGEPGLKKFSVSINKNVVNPIDPFLLSHRATTQLPEESLTLEGQIIRIKPYILPHLSKMSQEDLEYVGGEEGLRKQQGFYVYRNRRLIIWGTWFRLVKQEELSKLARVRVDIPNALDHLWTIDVKKSTAHPPQTVRDTLRRIIDRIVNNSKRVYKFRGRKAAKDEFVHTWEKIQGREGISYKINREHPLLKMMMNSLGKESQHLLNLLLNTLETTYPFDALYADMASDNRVEIEEDCVIKDRLKELAELLFKSASVSDGGVERILNNLHLIEPFCLYPEVTKQIVKECEKNDRKYEKT